MTSFDTIIIGAGHNGLTAAAVLARAGRKVIVLEASEEIGGGALTREFAPGFKVDALAHVVNRLAPEVEAAIGLDLGEIASTPAPTVLVSPEKAPIILHGGYGDRIEGIAADEAARFGRMRDTLMSQASILGRFLARRPPRAGEIGIREWADLGLAGLSLIRNGREDARDFARMLLMNVADIADEYLTEDRLKGLIAFDATLGIHLGPRSPTSLLGLYYRLTGAVLKARGGQFIPRGGMIALARAFATAASRAGAEIRVSAPVARILTERGTVLGVMLENGETISAGMVISAIHPATTLRSLAAPGEIDTGLAIAMKHFRSRGDAAKLHLALDRLPAFPGLDPKDLTGRLVIAPSIDHVENAFNPSKYGAFSPDPVMEITVPSLANPDFAPDGGAVLSAVVQFAPYELREGWEAGKPRFLEAIMAVLERYAPGIGATVSAAELLVPPDIEERHRMPGGHWHHGELQVDQMLFNRPTFAVSGYDTPIAGLYLASAGSHPGGGISGLPGLNAARHALSGRMP